jgi:MoxR-like ATPase
MYTRKTDDIPPDDRKPRAGDDPAAYIPDDGLVNAVNVALMLERPLLLTGDPGTGKTQLAHSLAWQLAGRKQLAVASADVERFETKSTSVSRDLFYSFDVVGRFHAAHTDGSKNNLDYITYNALGRAVLEGLPREAIGAYLPDWYQHRGPRRCVVLIDEIDKAPRDFPNDLLNEIDSMFFRLPELKNAQIGGTGQGLKPIVVITSNSERSLPDPFLRRCIYYDIPRPTPARLEEILLARLARLGATRGGLLGAALGFYLHLRDSSIPRRKISVAELLQWLTYLLSAGAQPGAALKDCREQALAGLPALIKDPEDQQRVRAELESLTAG